jgi:hypothetical protein
MHSRVDVEATFTNFIRAFGGVVVADLLGPSPTHPNADFYFPSETIIAELKCLTDDKSEDQNLQAKVQLLFDRWMDDGTIPTFYGENVRIDSKRLPEECQRALHEIYKAPIQRRIIKANKQIKATAQRLRLERFLGVLLLVNDGNYALEADAMLYQIWRILGSQFRHINNVVYFTVNMPATSPRTPKPTMVWAQATRKSLPSASETFLNSLWNGWRAHLEAFIGEPIDELRISNLSELGQVRYSART